jgi:hypothetical protein
MSAVDRGRLVKLLGLLGSDHDGEVLNAARQVERLRRDARLTWSDILAGAGPREDPLLRGRFEILLADHKKLRADYERLVVDNGRLMVRIGDLEMARSVPAETAGTPVPSAPEDIADLLDRILPWEHHLNEWQRGFVHDLLRRRTRRLSLKQRAALEDIVSKIGFYRRQKGAATA